MAILKVAVVTKHSTSRDREARNMGYWSYDVPEFEWIHTDGFNMTELNQADVVVQEDAGPRKYKGLKKPLVYVAIDSTLSLDHLEARRIRAKNANLILVDHDDLAAFSGLDAPVRRWNYCVNDHLFKPVKTRTVDVSFHCAGNRRIERQIIREKLQEFCDKKGYSFASGVLHPVEYAKAMARSKIVVNWPANRRNRSHRVLDTLACNSCLISGPIPMVDGDYLNPGNHYFEVSRIEDLPGVIEDMLESGDWQEMAGNGHRMAMKYHTWARRAGQLREMLQEEFGL